MKLNQKVTPLHTHEGAVAKRLTKEQELRRSVLTCLLFEGTFYENGVDIAKRIQELIPAVDAKTVALLAIEARKEIGLRHVPLLIAREMARLPIHKRYVARLLPQIITRADQLTDFLALYWETNEQPATLSTVPRKRTHTLSSKVKQGLAHAFTKFDEYQLAKYNQLDKKVKLKDVLFMSHAKPKDLEQAALWKRLINNQLKTPDTWNVALSRGDDKKATFERLMTEKKLGALAFVRNLRNMHEAGVDRNMIEGYGEIIPVDKVYPYQLIAAAKEVPFAETLLDSMIKRAASTLPKLDGKTILLVDNSGSMANKLSAKSKMSYQDAACGLAMILKEQCGNQIDIYAFSDKVTPVPPRTGFALRDAIMRTDISGTDLGRAVRLANTSPHDRLIVITDEQSRTTVPNPVVEKAYMINVAANKNGVGYGKWNHIDGFSANVLKWIHLYEFEFCADTMF